MVRMAPGMQVVQVKIGFSLLMQGREFFGLRVGVRQQQKGHHESEKESARHPFVVCLN